MFTYNSRSVHRWSLCIAMAVVLTGCGGGSDTPSEPGGDNQEQDASGGAGDLDNVLNPDPNSGGGNDVLGNESDATVNRVLLDDVSGNVAQFGVVSIEQPGSSLDPFASAGDISASFFGFSSDFPARAAIENYQPALDTCLVDTFDFNTQPDADSEVGFDGVDFQTFNAGEQIVFSSPLGTYIELVRQDVFGFTIYAATDEDLPGSVPNGLTFDISGDEFPAFANVSVPDVQPLTGVSPSANGPFAAENVTGSTVFTWNADNNPNVFVSISARKSDIQGTNISTTSVNCLARDDGQFSFPADVQAELGDGFVADSTDVLRLGVNILQRGNSILFVSNISSN